MKIYAAPMEGITGYIYRNVHHRHFEGVEKYYTPFVVSNYTRKFKHREKEDIAPENNAGIPVVPQVLGNKAEEVLWAASEFASRGYREFNLNLGCPVPTVAKKKKGSGLLGYPEELDRFLGDVYEGLEKMAAPIQMSIKTRLGVEDFDSAKRLIEIYNKYPVCELTIHPRTQRDMYKNKPNLDVFESVMEICTLPVCYNGNVSSKEDFTVIQERFPEVDRMMLGRGMIADPSLPRLLAASGADVTDVDSGNMGARATAAELRDFHDDLYRSYQGTLPGGAVIINRMKEIWYYMGGNFENADRYLKEIRKAKNPKEYEAAVRILFSCCRIRA